MDQKDADRAIVEIYEALFVPGKWRGAFNTLSETCGARGLIAHCVEPDGIQSLPSPALEEFFDDFLLFDEHFPNLRMERGLALTARGHKGLITEQDCFTPEDYWNDPWQAELAVPHGFGSYAGEVVASHGDARFVIAMERHVREDPYTKAELAEMNRLFDRLKAAFSLAVKLKLQTGDQFLATLGSRREAMALLSPTGRVLSTSAGFDDCLGDGLSLRGGRLRASDPASDAALEGLVGAAAEGARADAPPLEALVIPRPEKGPLIARCLPIQGAARDIFALAKTVLTLDPLMPEPAASSDVEMARRVFGLTEAEMRLARHLRDDRTLRAACEIEGIAYETGRTRLKTIFSKTRTSRQVELVNLLGRLAGRG